MATAKTKMPKTDKPVKSAAKSAQTLKVAPKTLSGKAANAKADTREAATDLKADIKATAAAVASAVPTSRDEIVARIDVLKADLAELTSSLKTQGATMLDEKTADVRAAAYQKAEQAKDKYGELAADTEARIRANPLTAVAIAAGVGLVFGAISRR